jgi:drug/metabolite transporter (DMT)-like permease
MTSKTIVPASDRWRGQGAVLLCAFLWSTSGLFIKFIDWHPVVISGVRSLVAFLFLWIVGIIFPDKGKIKNKPGPLWAGALVYAFTMITFVTANKLTSSANVIMLQYSAPVWAALLGWLLIKEKPHWEHWAALVMVAGGLLLFFRDGISGGSLLGDFVALLSGVFFGAHSVILRMMKNGNPRQSMHLAYIVNVIISIPFLITSVPYPSAPALLSLLFMGTIQIGCAAILFSYGIKRISAVQAMLTATIEPILNPLWVFMVVGEKPSFSALAGGSLIIFSVLFSSLISKRREN